MKKLQPILLVEDDANDLELSLEALKGNNIRNEIITVRDGEEALDYLFARGKFAGRAPGHPAVVLLDLKMPKVDGVEVLRRVKADNNLKVIPVVVLTSSREDTDLARCYELGVNAYVVKPVDFGQFVGSVQQLGLFWAVINETLDQDSIDRSSSKVHIGT